MVNLMYTTAQAPCFLDVMDYIWNEMIAIIKEMRSYAYAPFLHAFIGHVGAQDVPPFEWGLRLRSHDPIRLYIDKELEVTPADEYDLDEEDHDEDPDLFDEPDVYAFVMAPRVPSRPCASEVTSCSRVPHDDGKFMHAIKSIFCMTTRTHHCQYHDHVYSKEMTQRDLPDRRVR